MRIFLSIVVSIIWQKLLQLNSVSLLLIIIIISYVTNIFENCRQWYNYARTGGPHSITDTLP